MIADQTPPIEAARQAAAAAYPEHLVDSMGRKQENIPRRNILAGKWDDGSLVRSFLEELERRER